jgi:hypothetical protein
MYIVQVPVFPTGLGIFFILETHINRQVTLHDCLSSLLGDGDK